MQSAAFSLWSAVLSDWGFGEITGEGRKSVFLFLLLVLQPGLRAGEASLWFGDGLGALALYTSAASDPLFIMYLSVYLPPSVCVCLRALELQGLGSRVGCSQLRSVASVLAGTGDFPGV